MVAQVRVELAQRQPRAVVLLDHLHRARRVVHGDRRAPGDDVQAVHGFVVLAHVVEALGRADVIVEGDAGADDVDEGRTLVLDRGLDQRHELGLVAGEAARHEGRAELQRDHDEVDGLSLFVTPRLLFEPRSAVAENWPLVRPYTPLFSTI